VHPQQHTPVGRDEVPVAYAEFPLQIVVALGTELEQGGPVAAAHGGLQVRITCRLADEPRQPFGIFVLQAQPSIFHLLQALLCAYDHPARQVAIESQHEGHEEDQQGDDHRQDDLALKMKGWLDRHQEAVNLVSGTLSPQSNCTNKLTLNFILASEAVCQFRPFSSIPGLTMWRGSTTDGTDWGSSVGLAVEVTSAKRSIPVQGG